MMPDEIISADGPYGGTQGDWRMFFLSEFQQMTQTYGKVANMNEEGDFISVEPRQAFVYSDLAYFPGFLVIDAYRHTRKHLLTQKEETFNTHKAKKHISIQHGFGKSISVWEFI